MLLDVGIHIFSGNDVSSYKAVWEKEWEGGFRDVTVRASKEVVPRKELALSTGRADSLVLYAF
jgi:hypothetical protein